MDKNIKNIIICISLWNIMTMFVFIWFTILIAVITSLSGLVFIDNMKMLYPVLVMLSIILSSITTYKYMVIEKIIKPFELNQNE